MRPITVTTYNLLATAYIKPERYPNCDEAHLRDSFREPLLLKTIRALDSDIYCLQEVDAARYDAIAEMLLPTHAGGSALREGRPDGCAIFARTERFSQQGWPLVYENARPGENQLALMWLLRDGDFEFGVASTHLQWMPHDTHPDHHLGALQLAELVEATHEYDVPWILTGDFNATSQSPALQVATDAGFALAGSSSRPWDTTNINGRLRKLDYLLYTADAFDVSPLALPQLEPDTPMPSAIYASDHLPVTSAFAPR